VREVGGVSLRVLVVDDEPAVLAGFAHSVEALGYSCSECSDPRMAKAVIEAGEADLVFLDLLDERHFLEASILALSLSSAFEASYPRKRVSRISATARTF